MPPAGWPRGRPPGAAGLRRRAATGVRQDRGLCLRTVAVGRGLLYDDEALTKVGQI